MLEVLPLTSQNFIAPGFEAVQTVFEEHFTRGWDVGSAFAVFIDGQMVVNLAGGVRSKTAEAPVAYDTDTIQLLVSCSKFVESLCIAVLVDRGWLTYDDRIVDHWPEFAPEGSTKAKITVRQLMMHRAGLPVFDRNLTDDELFDHDQRELFLEQQPQVAELFEPEPADGNWRQQSPAPPHAYHAVSRGLYSGALLRRVDPQHRTMGQFLHEELALPLGLDLWLGLPEAEEHRVSPTTADRVGVMHVTGLQPSPEIAPDDPRYQVFEYEVDFFKQFLTQPESLVFRCLNTVSLKDVFPQELGTHRSMRACEMASSTCVGNALALAKLAALVVGGGEIEGKHIFAHPETLDLVAELAESYAKDSILGTPVEYTQGGLARFYAQDREQTLNYGWGGAGGLIVRYVPSLKLGCAYVTNTGGVRMNFNDPRGHRLLAAAIECARKSQA